MLIKVIVHKMTKVICWICTKMSLFNAFQSALEDGMNVLCHAIEA